MEPGRSNAGAVEEYLREFEERAMRGRHENEFMVRYVLRAAPRMVMLWRLTRCDHDAAGEKKGDEEEASLKAFVERMEKEAKDLAKVEGVAEAEPAGAEVFVQSEGGEVVTAEGEGEGEKKEDEDGLEESIDSACAVAGSPAEEKKQLEGEEAVGWKAELVLLGGREAKTA